MLKKLYTIGAKALVYTITAKAQDCTVVLLNQKCLTRKLTVDSVLYCTVLYCTALLRQSHGYTIKVSSVRTTLKKTGIRRVFFF